MHDRLTHLHNMTPHCVLSECCDHVNCLARAEEASQSVDGKIKKAIPQLANASNSHCQALELVVPSPCHVHACFAVGQPLQKLMQGTQHVSSQPATTLPTAITHPRLFRWMHGTVEQLLKLGGLGEVAQCSVLRTGSLRKCDGVCYAQQSPAPRRPFCDVRQCALRTRPNYVCQITLTLHPCEPVHGRELLSPRK